jgi:hypothetical protein
LFKSLSLNLAFVIAAGSLSSCASTPLKWEGEMARHVKSYMATYDQFRTKICVPRAETIYSEYLKAYRGAGYWIPELRDDVDIESIKSLLPEMERKVAWIKDQKKKVSTQSFPTKNVTTNLRALLKRLLALKKSELDPSEDKKEKARKESLQLQIKLQREFEDLIKRISFFTNYHYPVDHLKNRKVHDQFREKEADEAVKITNYTFLYRKLLEDGAYYKDHTGSDIYLRTTLDTLHFELLEHDFYLTEDARYDLEFVLGKIDSELAKGKQKMLERLTEWEARSERTFAFYHSLTLPENQISVLVKGEKTTPNRELIKEHNMAAERLKQFVYAKQAEVYNYWLHQPELSRAIFVLETILLNEVGSVDGTDALERMDVARVVMNRLDKPKYLSIGKKEFIYPYLKKVTTDFHLQNERWLNALFKQGEFSFTYYYLSGVVNIFCPDMAPSAKKLRAQNVEIALQVLKEPPTSFKTTRYFSRASMIGRIHMDSIWEDYIPYPERPGLLVGGQEKLREKFAKGDYTYLYSFKDPAFQVFQVIEIDGRVYALGEDRGIKIFYSHRNPHYFRYFTKTEI